jgi:hypothetical protein
MVQTVNTVGRDHHPWSDCSIQLQVYEPALGTQIRLREVFAAPPCKYVAGMSTCLHVHLHLGQFASGYRKPHGDDSPTV